jgi:hypothetical protein
MKRYGDFSIGDLVRLINSINSKLIGYIIEECEATKRYRIQWLTTLEPGISWASYDRLEKVS